MATRKRNHLPDPNKTAVRLVEAVTGSEPVSGEDLLGSEDLKRQLREAKEREAKRRTKSGKS